MIRAAQPSELTDYEASAGACIATGDELQAGDVLLLLGDAYRIDGLTPYAGALIDYGTLPEGTRTAHVAGAEFITVDPGQTFRILPRPEQVTA